MVEFGQPGQAGQPVSSPTPAAPMPHAAGAPVPADSGTPGWVWALIAGVVMLIVGCLGGGIVGYGVGLGVGASQQLTGYGDYGEYDTDWDGTYDFALSASGPGEVRVGEPFVVSLVVTNTSTETQTLADVDLHDGFFYGVRRVGSRPEAESTREGSGYFEQSFDRTVEPGEHVLIDIELEALDRGTIDGTIYVYDGYMNSRSVSVTVEAR